MSVLKNSKVILTAILIFGICLMIYHGYYKEYFYEDEVLSYTAANSQNGLWMNPSVGEWVSGDDLYSYIIVKPSERFDYDNVFANQVSDTHPPVYIAILHTICSLIAGNWSKWTGIGLNIACMVVVAILLYFLSLKFFPDKKELSLMYVFLWVCSIGTITQVQYLRMYMVLQIFTTACALWHVNNINREEKKSDYAWLFLITYFGTMTQYFYLINAFFFSVFFVLNRLYKKKIKSAVMYCVTMFVSAIVVLITWPSIVSHMFIKEVGYGSFHHEISVSDIISRIHTMYVFVNNEVFGGVAKIIMLVIGAFMVYMLCTKKINCPSFIKMSYSYWMLLGSSILAFVTITLVTPYLCDRYISPLFAYILLFVLMILFYMAEELFKSKYIGYAIVTVLFLCPEIGVLKEGLVDNNREIIMAESTEHSDSICLFQSNIPAEENVFELNKFDDIYIYLHPKDIEDTRVKDADELVVYISNDFDSDEIIREIQIINPKLKSSEQLYVAYYSRVYRLSSE